MSLTGTKRYLALSLGLPCLLAAILLGLAATETGSRWLLRAAAGLAPGNLQIARSEGALLNRLVLNDIRYHDETGHVQIKTLDFAWQPGQLLARRLKINQLLIDDVDVALKPANKPKEDGNDLANGIQLPIKPDIDKLIVTNLAINTGAAPFFVRKAQLSLNTIDEVIHITSLAIDSDRLQADAQGHIAVRKDFPLDCTLNWRADLADKSTWTGTAKLNGNLAKLLAEIHLTTPFKFSLHGDARGLLHAPAFQLQGGWEKLNWPPAPARPQIQSPKGTIDLAGTPDAYRIQVKGDLIQPMLDHADLTFDGTGNLNAMKIKQLDLSSRTGLFHLAGDVGWQPNAFVDLALSGVDFNPAIVVPDLPGSLDFTTRIKGRFAPAATQVNAEIRSIKGQLRQQPVEAFGTLDLDRELLKISGLQVESGPNKLSANGAIDKSRGELILTIDMPKFAALWPTWAGKLTGGGRLSGGWGNPALRLKLDGSGLKFAQHGIKRLDFTADYQPENNKTSRLDLIAADINSGSQRIDQIKLEGSGSLKSHDFRFNLSSPAGDLSTGLTGGWNKPAWRGKLNKFNIVESGGMAWSLAKPAGITVEQKNNGMEVVLAETCLTQHPAALCTTLAQFANGDLDMRLDANSLPSRLIQPWLPNSLALSTTLDGKADFRRKQSRLSGHYQFATSPTSLVINNKVFELEPSSLTGAINGDDLVGDFRLNLLHGDFIGGQLHLDIGSKQSISGKVKAELSDFSPAKAFLPQISAIQGRFSSDLSIGGTLAKPQLQGYFDLAEAVVETETFGLKNMMLTGRFDSSQGNRIKLQGKADPLVVNAPEADQRIDLKTTVHLDADLAQSPDLRGTFSLELPATRLAVNRKGFHHELGFNRSLLKGRLQNKQLVADLDIALPRNDFVRGQLSLQTDEAKTLSAQVNAAIHDFKLVEALAPDLSNSKGALIANAAVTGSVSQPKISAKVELSGGETDIERLGLHIRQVNLQALTPALTDNLLQVRGAAQSGEGKIGLDGILTLAASAPAINMTLTGKDFEVAKIPDAEAALSPNLKITSQAGNTRITGELAVPKAILTLQDIPENAVKLSPDEIILGETPPEASEIKAAGLLADVLITLGNNVKFSGQGLATDLSGQLRVIKDNDKLAMQGSVNMINARYKSYGQDLSVRKGQFVFNGPVDNPWLDVEAIRLSKDKKVTAVLKLSGQVDNPQTHISSEPPLPESEALAYLVTGGPLNQVSKAEGNVLASAAIAYGADQAGWLADKLGISDFSVQQGSTLKDTLLVMGKYLTPDFYMGARVGMFNKQAVMVLKHKLIDGLNVETQAGTSQRVKLNYEFDAD